MEVFKKHIKNWLIVTDMALVPEGTKRKPSNSMRRLRKTT